jgi:predicted permease
MVVQVPGAAPLSDRDRTALVNFITPGWFATYGTALRGGRDFDDRDTATAAPVVVVNDAFVRMFFPGRSAIGATITVGIGPRGEVPLGSRTIVGVVGDAVYRSLREEVRPTVYLPLAQWPDVGIPMNASLTLSVRAAAGPPAALAHSVAAALTAIDGRLAFSFRPLAERVSASLQQERLIATLSGFFGALALLLAGLGLYGVTAYAVSRRRMEIGIRMALGAAPGRVVRLVLSRVSMLVGIGVLAGAGASLWASTFVATLLYGLEPRDPATLAGAAAVLAGVGAAAGWLPAWRASRIDPAEVVREH